MKKLHLFITVFLITISVSGQSIARWVSESDQVTDPGTSQDPTSVTTYVNKDGISSIYFIYVNKDREMVVAKKTGDVVERSAAYTLENPPIERWHICPTIGVDKNGYVHIIGDMHNQGWKYFVSTEPESITSWDYKGAVKNDQGVVTDTGVLEGNSITYPTIFYGSNREMFIAFRQRGSVETPGNHRGGVIRYDADAKTYTSLGSNSYDDGGTNTPNTLVWSNGNGADDCWYNKTGIKIHFDDTNRMHLTASLIDVCVAKPGPGEPNVPYAVNTHVIYAYSDDLGTTWHKAGGEPITSLPLTVDNASIVVDRTSQTDINGGDGEVGAFGPSTPIVSYQLRGGNSYTRKWDGTEWVEITPPNKAKVFMSGKEGYTAWYNGKTIDYSSDGVEWEQLAGPLPGGVFGQQGGIDREYFKQTGNFRYHGKFDDYKRSSIFTIYKDFLRPNIAVGKSVTTSSNFNEVYTGDKAVDGLPDSSASRWVSQTVTATTPQTITVDLEADYIIGAFGVRTGNSGNYSNPIRDYTIEYLKDDGTWESFYSETENTNSNFKHSFSEFTTSMVRLTVTNARTAENGSDQPVRLYELELYGEIAPVKPVLKPNVALNKPVEVSATPYANYNGEKAVDGEDTNASRWISDPVTESNEQWIVVDLGEDHLINGFGMRTGTGGNYANPIESYRFEYEDENGDWIVITSASENTEPNYKSAFDDVRVSKVRLSILATQGTNQPTRLYELEVYGESVPTASIKDIANKMQMNIYPNPCDSILYLKKPTFYIGNLTISNMNGRVLKTISSSELLRGIDISKLNSGVYFISGTIIGDGKNVAKFIKK